MTKYAEYAAPLGRAALALIFIVSGFQKIGAYEWVAGWMDSLGVPGALLPLVIAFEIVAGIALLVGFQARIVAFLLAGFSVVTAVLFHWDFADQTQQIMFMKNISIAGGFLMIVAHGAGAYALDNLKKSRNEGQLAAAE